MLQIMINVHSFQQSPLSPPSYLQIQQMSGGGHQFLREAETWRTTIMSKEYFWLCECIINTIFLPPPLGGGGIMFSGCPYGSCYRDISRMTKAILIKFGMKVNCGVEMN